MSSANAPQIAPSTLDLTEAFRIAVEVHGGQRDKAGEPYLFHVMRVAMAMETDEERAVAILHDALEDAPPPPYNRLKCIALPIELAYGSPISGTVLTLTRFDDEPYMDYIRRLSANPLAVKVKLADLRDNSDPKRLRKLPPDEGHRLAKKYYEAYVYLFK